MGHLRLQLRVKGKFYYDIGLRRADKILSKTQIQFGRVCPRFLEDFIERYGEKHIDIIDYGKLIYEREYIDNLLKI